LARRRGFVQARMQGPRRATEWGASADVTTATTLAAATNVIQQSFSVAVLSDVVPTTIVRVRGHIWVASDQASVSEEPFGAIGFALVSQNALTAGVASIPGPITNEPDDRWFVYETFQAYFATGEGVSWQRYDFDSKAMRKVEDGDALVVMVENAHSTMGLEFIVKFRILFKLH